MSTVLTVQFRDSSEESIITYFGSPQNAGDIQNLGTVDTADTRWAAFYEHMLSMGLAAGLPEPTTD